MIALTTAVGADRTASGTAAKIEPDEVVDGVKPAWPGDDPTLATAVRWLKQSSGCGTGLTRRRASQLREGDLAAGEFLIDLYLT